MSLLERLGGGHLSDRTFARLWSSSEQPEGHSHLESCAECRARFDAFDRWMAGIGATMREEADEAFPPERLAAQQAQISRRLEALGRQARVIAFPKAARAVISGHSHVRRWVTVAAAASLIAGFGLGQVVPVRTLVNRQQQVAASQPQLTQPETVLLAKKIQPASSSLNDEELLSDAFTRPHVSALTALDDMTPHARDISRNAPK